MKNYSQNSEQEHILNYFKNTPRGTYLDIGAYDPEVFSNTRALYELGWKGVLVEPADMNHEVLRKYFEHDKEIQLIKTCVGDYDGEITFYDSGGDAISSTDPVHVEKWTKGYKVNYTKVVSPICTFASLIEKCAIKKFDFINIDVEGVDFQILRQIDFNAVGCSLVCVENNGKEKDKYLGHMHRNQFRLIHSNGENLIFGK